MELYYRDAVRYLTWVHYGLLILIYLVEVIKVGFKIDSIYIYISV